MIFTFLFLVSIFADFIANEKPLLIKYQNQIYLPIINEYAETTFGGDFETEADYRDPFVKDLINNNGWMIWPIIPYSYDTIIRDLAVPAPAPPSKKNWLGTDDQARDVLARLIYGFRISILFGFTLTFFLCSLVLQQAPFKDILVVKLICFFSDLWKFGQLFQPYMY